MRDYLRQLWTNHGTKILGIATAITGLIEYIDVNTLNLVGGFLGPKWGPIVSKSLQVAAGLMIAHRGYTNSRRT